MAQTELTDELAPRPQVELVQAFEVLLDAEREAMLARVVSSISHALGTPLNVIAGRATMVSMPDLTPAEIAENARIIEQQVRSITGLLQQVLRFARTGGAGPQQVRLLGLVHRAVQLVRPLASERGLELEVYGDPGEAVVHGDRIVHVLTNLLSWGLQSTPEAGSIRVELSSGYAEPPPAERGRTQAGRYAKFLLTCTGAKLDSGLLSRVYEPWFEPGARDRSTALLLAVSFGLVRESRGWIEPQLAQKDGVGFAVYWPMGT